MRSIFAAASSSKRLRLSLAEQHADDGFAERGGQLVRFRVEVGRRHLLRQHVLRGLIVGPRFHVFAIEVRRPDREDPLHLMMIHVVLRIADEPHELPRHLLVRAVLVDEVRPGEQGSGAGANLFARQRVDLEVHVGRVLLQPAEEPRLAKDDGGAFLAEGIFGIAEREARHLVLHDQVAEERQRRHHLRAVGVTGGLVQIRAQHPRAPGVRKREELVRDADRSALAANGEAHLRRLASLGIGNRQLLQVREPNVKVLGGLSGFRPAFLNMSTLMYICWKLPCSIGMPYRAPSTCRCRPCTSAGSGRRSFPGRPASCRRNRTARPLVRHAHEDVGCAALGHERRQVLGLVSLVGMVTTSTS